MAKNAKSLNDMFGRRAVTAAEPDLMWPLPAELVGVEIEVEDLQGDPASVMPLWTVHPDQSLRNGTEFVTAGPVGGKQLTRTLDKFFDAKYRYSMSPRTSVHIHVNASDNMTVDQFRNLFVIMYLVEPAVFRWADENRKWCGYCAPLTDLDPNRIVTILNENRNDQRLIQAIRGGNNQDRYYGLNVAAYHKHGTAEFRYFPCTENKQDLVDWIKFVLYVKAAAMTYEEPADLLNRLSSREAVRAWIEQKFPDTAGPLINNLDFDDCLGRVRELTGMLGVLPEHVRAGEAYKTYRSKGLTKFLASTFPKIVEKLNGKTDEDYAEPATKAYQEFQNFVAKGDLNAAHTALKKYNDLGGVRAARAEHAGKLKAGVKAAPPAPQQLAGEVDYNALANVLLRR
jgi:hypothetical protein